MGFDKKEFISSFSKTDFEFFVLSADVGGTNTRLAVSGVKANKPAVIFSAVFKSKKQSNLYDPINEVLKHAKENYDIEVGKACFAVAGPVINNCCKLTNLEWVVSADEILSNTLLGSVFLINDFEAIGYSINVLGREDMIDLGHGNHPDNKPTKAVIGAGTGLGKSIPVWEDSFNAYAPRPSEGGHTDFPAYDDFEVKMWNFIKKRKKLKIVSYEDLLSGKGIRNIYKFIISTRKYKKTKYSAEIEKAGFKSKIISKYRGKDAACRETMKFFTKFYARCAKNFMLDTMALGGVYIGGGIAANNAELFQKKLFIKEFETNDKKTELLKAAPLFVIKNENAGLIGAAFAALIREDLAVKK